MNMSEPKNQYGPYTTRPCGSTGYEILDPQGRVFAWTVDELWAVRIVALLNTEERFS
jgi:hypothetical protein